MNMVRAKIAPTTVQQQSVIFLYFSFTGSCSGKITFSSNIWWAIKIFWINIKSIKIHINFILLLNLLLFTPFTHSVIFWDFILEPKADKDFFFLFFTSNFMIQGFKNAWGSKKAGEKICFNQQLNEINFIWFSLVKFSNFSLSDSRMVFVFQTSFYSIVYNYLNSFYYYDLFYLFGRSFILLSLF